MATAQALPDPRFDLLFEQRPGYLFVHVAGGSVSLEVASAYWSAIADQCRGRRPQPLLVVEELSGESAEREDRVADFVGYLSTLDLKRFRIAVVKRVLGDMGLAERVEMGMRALDWHVRVFATEGEAMLWLLHGAD